MMSEKLSKGLYQKDSPCLFKKGGRVQMLHCGKIVNTHGIGGEIKMLYYADSPDFLKCKKALFEKRRRNLS